MDFYYFDYDNRNKKYFLDFYSDGKKERSYLEDKEEINKFKKIRF